ncbi:MAG: penicillin acylase family protein [Gammaproteobacteria bacterium]|nr:penicillin acylase family protein [Gammaproteobacteria bacterium]
MINRLQKCTLLIIAVILLGACQQQNSPAPAEVGGSVVSAQHTPAANADPPLQRQRAHAANVTIVRDDFGVPHIYGKTDADAVFGLMYAQAEDDFARIERNYYWAIGRLAEVEGEQALYSDLRARLYMSEAEAKAFYATAPDWLQELCQAWADGLNFYLRTHPQVQPKLITQFQPWMTMYFFEGSIGGDIEQIPLPRIAEFYADVPEPAAIPVAAATSPAKPWLSLTDDDDEPRGSNGFAIAGELTRSGNSMLLINPHTSFYFRGEVHVVSEQGLNAYGAVTWGQFFIYQGFNEHSGWMHTSTHVDFIDEFVEHIERRDGRLMYRYGDDWRPLEVAEITLNYRDAGGKLQSRRFPGYRTLHGPITHTTDGRWTATRINWNPVEALRQSWLRIRQHDYDSFRDMMQIRTNSSNNTVYADSSGNIAYFHGNFVPRRDPRFDYARPVDGSDPATDWQGVHDIDELVTLLNPASGWIQNANSTPFTAAGRHSPNAQDYLAYMAPDAENFRGIHAVRVLRQADDLTLDKLIELAYDPQLPAFEVLLPGLLQAHAELAGEHQHLAAAVAVLRDWDHRVRLDSVAMTLAHFYASHYLAQADLPNGLDAMQQIEYLATQTPPAERLLMLQQTLDGLQADFGRWQVPWGEVNRFQRITGAIDSVFDDDLPSLPVPLASGNWGALASYGVVHGRNGSGEVNKKLYGVAGNSFVAVVEFGQPLRAKTLLAGGQSGDPASDHFLDQAQRYVDVQFKDVAFYRDDVERRARRSYHPGE